MTVGSTRSTQTSLAWCPNCDMPLRRRVNSLSGTVAWKDPLGVKLDRCPRCGEWLPVERPDIALVNHLLAEAGEPETCAEEMERGPWAGRSVT